MTTNLTRRDVIAAVPATAAGMSLPAHAGASDPVIAFYHEWQDARRTWLELADLPGNGNFDFPESLAAERREDAAIDAMTDLTPTSLEGIAALAHILWTLEGPTAADHLPKYLEQAGWPSNRILSAIWRAGSGLDGLPR